MTWTIYRADVADKDGRRFQVWRTEPLGFGARARGYAAIRLTPGVWQGPTHIVAYSEREALIHAGFHFED